MKRKRGLTWDELANLYDAAHPGDARPARTLPMDYVFAWAERQKKRFEVTADGSLHLRVAPEGVTR